MARDLVRELEQCEGTVTGWKPQVGDYICGRLVRFDSRVTKFGAVQIAVIEQDGGRGKVGVWTNPTVLRRAFDEHDPRPGDRVAIRYDGRHPEKQYHLFRMVIDRAQPQPQPPTATPYAAATVSRGPAEMDPRDPFGEEGR